MGCVYVLLDPRKITGSILLPAIFYMGKQQYRNWRDKVNEQKRKLYSKNKS